MQKRDSLLTYIIVVLEKLGSKITITQKDIDNCAGKNLAVVMGPHQKWRELSIIDIRAGHKTTPISENYYSSSRAMQSAESTAAELTNVEIE